MLKARVITGVVLALLFFGASFGLSGAYLALALAVVMLLCAWEWHRLAHLNLWESTLFYLVLAALLAAVYFFDAPLRLDDWLLWASFLWWTGVAVVILRYRQVSVDNRDPVIKLSKAMMGLMVLVPAFWALAHLHSGGALNTGGNYRQTVYFLYAFFIAWAADIGAYFVGKKWGKHKLAPAVSPGKTVEGALGGLACVAILALAFALIVGGVYSWQHLLLFVLSSALVGFYSIFGDLFESLLKRQANIKDSSNLLPGHGGLLDRLDSVLAIAPLWLLVIQQFGFF